MNRLLLIAVASIVVGAIVFALKFLAYRMTGSVAFYSEALESLVNIAAAFAAFIALMVSRRPADSSHPYGHHKVEYFSAVLEGVLIVVAALAIMREAWFRFFEPLPIEAPLEGIALNVVATIINAGWALFLLRVGRRNVSPALVADAKHLLTDVATSVGVVTGVGLAYATGWLILDPLLAAVVAANILWSGWRLVRESLGALMDEALPAEMQERIRSVISEHAAGAIEAHDLKTRSAGPMTFIEFHLVVPGGMRVSDAHDICDRIEHALKNEFGRPLVTIHVEPEDKAKHSGIVVL